MASKKVSPTARLLRHSRLFSLPPPLPRPTAAHGGASMTRGSDTATLPHPITAAIATTPQGLARGDWGMKRPLPLKSTTKTSTPVIRVHEVDSIDHITDFESAADHVLTLRKVQEMDLPIYRQQKERRFEYEVKQHNVSVFEDNLQPTTAPAKGERDNGTRWKFRGPWLAGLSQGEFDAYISTKIRKRRKEFLEHIRSHLYEEKILAARVKAMEEGKDYVPQPLTDAEFESGLAKLRQQDSELCVLVWNFLDLPGVPPVQGTKSKARGFEEEVDKRLSATSQLGPPATHPSAGLSYLRTNSVIYNHPALGPVRSRPPVEARVLQHAKPGSSRSFESAIGVAGVVAMKAGLDTQMAEGRHDRERASFNPSLAGGAKTWTSPQHASIDLKGRIKLSVQNPDRDQLAIWEHEANPGSTEEHATSTISWNPAMGFNARQAQEDDFLRFMRPAEKRNLSP